MKDVFAPNGGALLDQLVALITAKGHDVKGVLAERAPHLGQIETLTDRLPAHEHAIVLEMAEAVCGHRQLGYRLAATCDLKDCGLTGYAFGAAATLGDALQVLVHLSELFHLLPSTTDQADEGARSLSDTVEVRWDYGASGKLDLRIWSEFTAALLVRSIAALTGGAAKPLSVSFTHRNFADPDEARLAFGLAPTFHAAANGLTYALRDLALPFESADPRLLKVLLEHADLQRRIADLEQKSLALTVERLIMDGMAQGDASLAKVSERLGVSQRTLSRKLAVEDTSFFAILEGVRKSLALRYLRQNEKSLSEISFLLGYSSLSSFNDAFRRWTGHSPGNYRNRTIRAS